MCEEFSGWANAPTWSMHLWLSNDQTMYSQAREVAQHGPEPLRDWVEATLLLEPAFAVGSIANDLAYWSFERVDWDEVAEALTED